MWNIVTAAIVETDVIRVRKHQRRPLSRSQSRVLPNILNASKHSFMQLAVQICFILIAGVRAEQLAPPSAGRVGWTLLAALLVSGACVSFGSLMMYLSSTDETFLYKPLWGTGPVVAALSVAAHQVLGDAPILPTHAPSLSFSLLPLTAVAVAAVSQFGVLSSRDFVATCISLCSAWVYLRWIHTYAPGVVGDMRDEFEFLAMVPNPFR